MSTPPPGQAHPLDLPAMAALAIHLETDARDAANTFNSSPVIRERWRAIADAAISASDLAAQGAPAARMTPEQQTAAGVGTIRHAPTGATWITWPWGNQPPWELIDEAVGRLTGGAVKVKASVDADEPGRLTVAVYRDLPPNPEDA